MLDNGTLQRYIDEYCGHRADVQPDDLRRGDRRQRRLRCRHPREGRAPASAARRCSSSWRWRTCAAPPTCSAPSTTPPAASTAGCRWKLSPLLADDTAGSIEAAARIHAQAGARQPVREDPGHARRRAGDRGIDLRRRADQRDPAVLHASSTWPRPTPTCAASSAASRPGSTRWSRRSPRCSSAAGTRPVRTAAGRAAQPARHRRRAAAPIAPIASCSLRSAGRSSPRPARSRSACCGRAPAPRIPQRSDTLYIEALAAPDTINTMPEKTLRAFADHGRCAARWPRTAAMPRPCCGRIAEAGIDIDALADAAAARRRGSFVKSWKQLLQRIADKAQALAGAHR